MMEYEYQIKAGKIRRKNHIWFAGVVGGLASLTIAAGIYIKNPNMPYEQKRDVSSLAYSLSTTLIMGTAVFFTGKERGQLRRLEEEYEKTNKKKR